ncbi:hypothetical protein AeRB84_015262 [Aphanomyces euteiches]|nr:hypothetical protein AeRB84_015262 [Aphanomyces euteiches]
MPPGQVVSDAIVEAHAAMMAKKLWKRYQQLSSMFPAERATEATRAVDVALKTFWQKRGQEVFTRMFYLKPDDAGEKYGSLDQITGPLEVVLVAIKVAEEESGGDRHCSVVEYLSYPCPRWPMIFKAPICLKSIYLAHGGGDEGERVVLNYIKEASEWFPQVPSVLRKGRVEDWSCDPACTFRYYSQRSALKSRAQGELANFGVTHIRKLKEVCAKAIAHVDQGNPQPSELYDFVDLVFTNARSPGDQWSLGRKIKNSLRAG